MAHLEYAPEEPVRTARSRYFEANAFGANGGYDDAWVDFKFGPIPMPIPNTKARVRAVRFHDLHHIVTGYDTDLIGEFEISAWELGAGCEDFAAAWAINLGGLTAGMFFAPLRTMRAFARGRQSRSLYRIVDVEMLLDGNVAALRTLTDVPSGEVPVAGGDVARTMALASVGLATWGVAFVPGVIFGPFLAAYLKRAKTRATVAAAR